MFKKTRGKVVAAIMALALAISAIPTVGGVEAQAATKTKVMEAQVNFSKDVVFDDDSSIWLVSMMSGDNITWGLSYYVSMKIYVPAAFMNSGSLFVRPDVDFYSGDEGVYIGFATAKNYYLDKNSDEVTKVGDFYEVDVKIPVNKYYDEDSNDAAFPEGTGKLVVSAVIVGQEFSYTGSIYFDDLSLIVDDQVVASRDYENGNAGNCRYYINSSGTKSIPTVVTYTGNTLTVSKTSLTIKKGKKATIKTTTMPSAKVTFKSSNKKIATVTSKGVVKGIKKGKATISVKANGKTVKVKVTVK